MRVCHLASRVQGRVFGSRQRYQRLRFAIVSHPPPPLFVASSRFVTTNELEIRKYAGVAGALADFTDAKGREPTGPLFSRGPLAPLAPPHRPRITRVARKEDDRFAHMYLAVSPPFSNCFSVRAAARPFRRISRAGHFILLRPTPRVIAIARPDRKPWNRRGAPDHLNRLETSVENTNFNNLWRAIDRAANPGLCPSSARIGVSFARISKPNSFRPIGRFVVLCEQRLTCMRNVQLTKLKKTLRFCKGAGFQNSTRKAFSKYNRSCLADDCVFGLRETSTNER